MSKKIIKLTESKLKEIIEDKLAQAYGGNPRSFPSGEQWTMGEEKTSKEWLKNLSNIEVLDPDGWDRSNFDYSFNKEKITEEEFNKRLMTSTIRRS